MRRIGLGLLVIGLLSLAGVGSVAHAATPANGSGFHGVVPVRVLDSRDSTGGWSGKLAAAAPRSLKIGGAAGSGVPVSASAVVLNVTATGSSAGSFLTVWPAGIGKPNTSSLNFAAGETIPNEVTVRLGTNGAVSFATALGSVDVVADVVGYFDDGTGPGDLFTGVTPSRVLDSRSSSAGWVGPLPAGAPRDVAIRGFGGVPVTATSVVANVTVTQGTAGSFLSVWPSGLGQPNVSNLNFGPGQTIPNLVTVQIGTNGKIRVANAVGAVHVVVDVVGYFDPGVGSRFFAMDPTRILDDRIGLGLEGPQGPGPGNALQVGGVAGIPEDATGVVANVTATGGSQGSFLTVYPTGGAKPNASNLNFGPGQTIPNLVMVKTGVGGQITIANALGTVNVIADVVGWYAEVDVTPPAAPTGLTATAGDGVVSLQWNAVAAPDLAMYEVYRSTSAGSLGTKLDIGAWLATTFDDYGVTNGTTYYYRVKAVDTSANASAASNQVSALPKVPDFEPPPTPTDLVGIAGDAVVHLSWSAVVVGDLAGYNVYRSTSSGTQGAKVNGALLTGTTFEDLTVTNATTYFYVVTAVDTSANESAASAEVSAQPVTLTITTAGLPGGQVGLAYFMGLSAAGGAGPYTWVITTGALPAGLTLAPSTGLISGTPTSLGSSSFTVKVTGAGGKQATGAFSLLVTGAQDWTQSGHDAAHTSTTPDASLPVSALPGLHEEWSTPLSGGRVAIVGGAVYANTSTATSGSLLEARDLATGTPLWSVPVANCSGDVSATATALFMPCGSIQATRLAPPHDQLWSTATTDPGIFVDHVAPIGSLLVAWSGQTALVYDAATGARQWQQPSPVGHSIVDVAASGSTVVVTYDDRIRAFSLTTGAQLWIKTATPGGKVTIAGGFAYTASAGKILKLDLATGAQGWAITPPGGGVVTVWGADAGSVYVGWATFDFGNDSFQFMSFAVTDGALQWAVPFSSNVRSLAITNDALFVTWSDAGFYGGSSSGLDVYRKSDHERVSQTVFGARTYTETALANGHVVGVVGGALRAIGLAPALPSITTGVLYSGRVGVPYSDEVVASGGTPPSSITVAAGTLPSGITLAPSGTLSGTPTAAGSSTVTFRATDAAGRTATRVLTLQVNGTANQDWTTSGRNAGRDGFAAGESLVSRTAAPQLSNRWKTAAMEPLAYPFDGSQAPLVVGSRLFAVSGDAVVHAWDTAGNTTDRAWLWSATADADDRFASAISESNGKIYVVGQNGDLYALRSSDGVQLWKRPVPGAVAPFSVPLVVGGAVLYQDAGPAVRAFDAATGAPLWGGTATTLPKAQYTIPYAQVDHGWGLSSDGTRAFAVVGCEVSAITVASGAIAWSAMIDATAEQACNPYGYAMARATFAHGVVITSTFGATSAFDPATGARLWQAGVGGALGAAVSNGTVVLPTVCCVGSTSWNYELTALDLTTGRLLWQSTDAVGAPPTIAFDLVLTRSADRVYGYDLKTGERIYDSGTIDQTWSSLRAQPVVAGGRIYVRASDQTIRVLGPP